MEWTINTRFSPGDRVWMPDGKGGRIKGRVEKIMIFRADLSEPPEKTAHNLNYCVTDIEGNKSWLNENQLKERKL